MKGLTLSGCPLLLVTQLGCKLFLFFVSPIAECSLTYFSFQCHFKNSFFAGEEYGYSLCRNIRSKCCRHKNGSRLAFAYQGVCVYGRSHGFIPHSITHHRPSPNARKLVLFSASVCTWRFSGIDNDINRRKYEIYPTLIV